MKALLRPDRFLVIPVALAREIGLPESVALIAFLTETENYGITKNGQRMIARDAKQIAALLPWCKGAQVKKILESLCERNFLYIDNETLLTNETTRWYALNYTKLKTLNALVVMDDGEIEEAHAPKEKPNTAQLNGEKGKSSHAHQRLFGVFITACDFRQKLLTPRDRGEIGQAVKKLLEMYAGKNVETEEIEEAILGFRVWWIEEGKKFHTERNAPRPATILSNWGKYETSVRKLGKMPVVPEEWRSNET